MIPEASTAIRTFRSRFKASMFYLVPWAVVPATDVFLKTRVLKNGGLEKAAIAMGRSRGSFTSIERIAFLRGDLLVSCLLIPITILCLVHFLPDRLRWVGMWCLALLAFVAELLLFTQYGTFLSIGHFANFVVIWEGTKWWYAHPESTAGTPGKRLVISLVVAATIIVVSTVVASYLSRKPENLNCHLDPAGTIGWRNCSLFGVSSVLGPERKRSAIPWRLTEHGGWSILHQFHDYGPSSAQAERAGAKAALQTDVSRSGRWPVIEVF